MNTIVRATAGAGKTTGLLEAVYQRYKKSFLENGTYPKILLSTFTVKASNELTERLTKKAVQEKDPQFLNFVSSGFLEVGTLHSVFLKVYGLIKENQTREDSSYVSSSIKKKIGRSFLHEILKDENLTSSFTNLRDESATLELFWHLYSYSYKELKVPSFQSLQDELMLEAIKQLKSFDLINLAKSVQAGDEINLKEISETSLALADKDLKKQKPFKDFIKFCEEGRNQHSFLENNFLKNQEALNLFKKWSVKLDAYFESLGVFDVADIENRLLKELKKTGYKEKIWDFCFFDEYQDTSPIQKEILDFLAKKSVNYYVGDPFQSIYFFRGARKEIFLEEFEKIDTDGGAAEFRLNNYRSSKDIVDFSNGVIKSLVPDFMEMTPYHVNQAGVVSVVHFEKGGLQDELNFVAENLSGVNYSSRSAAVLCRSVKELLLLARVLKTQQIDFKLALSKGFESSLETIEMAHLIKFARNCDDDEVFQVLLFSHWIDVSHEAIKSAVAECEKNGQSLWSVFKDQDGCKALKRFLENLKRMNLSNAVTDFIGESGFLHFSEALDPSAVRERNILKFLGALSVEEEKEDFNVSGFADDVLRGYYRFESEDLSSESGVVLMTVHGSKGLQFDDVFLIGANKPQRGGAKPYFFDLRTHIFALKTKEDTSSKYEHSFFVEKMIEGEKSETSEERKRLLYVAMTRAKESLTVVGSKSLSKVSKDPTWLSVIIKYLETSGSEHLLDVKEVEGDSDEMTQSPLDLTGGFLENIKVLDFTERSFKGVTDNLHGQEGRAGITRSLNKFSTAIAEGVLFHEMMEKAADEQAALRLIPTFFSQRQIKKHEDAVKYLFSQTDFPFQSIFLNGEKEWGFDTFGDNKRSGKIDLWASIENTVWVVDYKTGATDQIEKGFEQLKAYREVLRLKTESTNPIFKSVLVFPYKKKVFIRS